MTDSDLLDPRLVPALTGALEVPVHEATLVFLDLEMTGLNPAHDRICEVGLLRCRGAQVEARFESLVCPGVAPGEGQQIHGIPEQELAAAPPFGEVAPRLAELIEGAVLVGHGVAVDEAFLKAELGRLGVEPAHLGLIDTLPLARRCFRSWSYRLEVLCRQLGIEQLRAHRAADDALATMHLFFREVAALEPASLAELLEVRVGDRRARPQILERARSLMEARTPAQIRYRGAGRPAEVITFVITAVLEQEPPLLRGYTLPGRSRRELRADRVLAILPPA